MIQLWQKIIPFDLFCIGRVVRADIAEDNEKKSKGHGTVQFDTPLEAINAVCILLYYKLVIMVFVGL